ncbi:MAG: FixH family protein [Calditrichaeota bacterium]|nr:FixH family protein [Calditrichota bacterium]MCB9088074.1 FixH family protein [Calditrichia bacterium]MCB0291299.1 FixH family protein [Calditrichota bacterium]MCB0296810.1 FixH family protein [Calditrichota bacterium]MCB0305553.1 FixH family protein [Calditrichota bacterium]
MIKPELRWPLGIAGVLGLFILFLVATVLFSRTLPLNLVSNDYYENALNYQKKQDLIRHTLEKSAALSIDHQAEVALLILRNPLHDPALTVSGKITFFRPSDASQDFVLSLALDEGGQQQISTASLTRGLWNLMIHWQVDADEYYQETALILE